MANTKTFLFLLFLFSFFLRSIFINQLPPSLNWDEVSHGFNAYSILKTGKDEWGSTLPLIFRAYGDFKLPLYIYLTTPLILIFGLNPFSVRLLSMLAGSLTPIILYLISKKYLSSKTALLVALISALSPWSIFLSRIALEANVFTFLLLLSFYFLLEKKYVQSTIVYSLSLFTYNSSRVYLPFYLILLFVSLAVNKINFKKDIFKYTFLIISLILVLFQSLQTEGQARYKWVSILDSGAINRINELRSQYPRFVVNKVTYFTLNATKNYISHFNPAYVFLNGSNNSQFNIPNFYLIHPLFFIFLLFGLFSLIKIKSFEGRILLLFFFISPIPSAITRDAPHLLRSLVFLPLIAIIIGLGIDFVISKLKAEKTIIVLILFLLTLSQYSFWNVYKNYAITNSQSWQYGYKEVIDYVKPLYDDYDLIVFTKKYGEPHEFILFHWPWAPSSYQNHPKDWDYHADWYWVNSFDKFVFLNDWELMEQLRNLSGKKILLITSPQNYNPQEYNLLNTINFLDSSQAFQILEKI
ncbi:MAG: ArnT family glycosyltransferase [Patescibacteria group bacterium]|jgi:4-amino-4-deoxy-L-arabinose transferase-like glycosyltransferase